MKAITIKQPWANLIVSGVKDIENRSWRTYFRGRVYIHASASDEYSRCYLPSYMSPRQFDSLSDYDQRFITHGIWQKSAIIGEVDIVDCVLNHKSIWAQYAMTYEVATTPDEKHEVKPIWNWVLANPVKYDHPILNVKGKLSFWDFSLTNSELTINI